MASPAVSALSQHRRAMTHQQDIEANALQGRAQGLLPAPLYRAALNQCERVYRPPWERVAYWERVLADYQEATND